MKSFLSFSFMSLILHMLRSRHVILRDDVKC